VILYFLFPFISCFLHPQTINDEESNERDERNKKRWMIRRLIMDRQLIEAIHPSDH
jgi:hypothetical protein